MSPAGIAQTEAENREYADKCAERTGVDVLAHVGTYDVVRDMDVIRAVLGDEKLELPRLLVRHPARLDLRGDVPGQRARDGPRRRPRSRAGPDGGSDPAGGRIPVRVRRVRRGLHAAAGLPAGHRPGAGEREVPGARRPADRQAGRDHRPARTQLHRCDHRRPAGPVLAESVGPAPRRSGELADGDAAIRC